jgi:hypothetical protein
LGHVALVDGDLAEAEACFAESGELFREIGNPLYVPWRLEGLADLAAERGCWEQAARLCGARDALRASLGSGLPAAAADRYDRVLDRTRAALGEAFALAYQAGQAEPLADLFTAEAPVG